MIGRIFTRGWIASILILFALGAPHIAIAQEISPEQMELGRKYVHQVGFENLYSLALAKQADDAFTSLVAQTPSKETEIRDAIIRAMAAFRDKSADLTDQYARLYATVFSTEELKAITDFYDTPAGRKLAAGTGQLAEEMRAIGAVFGNNLSKDFFTKVRAELKAVGLDM
ncbi:MAG: DUF2059 domain-containing protein [Devosia sp.]